MNTTNIKATTGDTLRHRKHPQKQDAQKQGA
jgi:hypothetical protein